MDPAATLSVRALDNGDLAAMTACLTAHAASSMFLLGNARAQGLEYSGRPQTAEYWGAFDGTGDMRGVLAHCWNGNVLLQAPDPFVLESLLASFGSAASRPVAGALGADDQVQAVLDRLGVVECDCAVNAQDGLYALPLDKLAFPDRPTGEALRVALAREAGRELLTDWIRAYEIEGLGAVEGPKLEATVVARVDGFMIREDIWVLFDGAEAVCLCGFNATLPEMVQIGPVWTPPKHRNRGYARHLLAATLAAARERGVQRAILFTQSAAAATAYEAVGFRKIGTYRIALLRDPVSVA